MSKILIIKIKGDKMKKDWYKSKTVWGGVLVFIGSGLIGIGLTEFGTVITGLGAALGYGGVRFAMK